MIRIISNKNSDMIPINGIAFDTMSMDGNELDIHTIYNPKVSSLIFCRCTRYLYTESSWIRYKKSGDIISI